MNKGIKVSIVGASGYTGMEAIRILCSHPGVVLQNLYGERTAGSRYEEIYKAMASLVDRPVLPMNALESEDADVVFLGLPHGRSAEAAFVLRKAGFRGYIIDMGSDFRLKNPEDYERWYGRTHPCPELIPGFVYGLTEWYRKEIRSASNVSNPGCFATAIQLGVIPFVRQGLMSACHVTGITGSSGSGSTPSAGTHFSSRFGNIKAYKVYQHQHLGEVYQSLELQLQEKDRVPEIHFVPVSGPFVRGIWMTISFRSLEEADAGGILEEAYYNAPLVRLREGLPELKDVSGSAFADLGCVQSGRNVVVGVAIDNLMKGAASQAIQNMNLMFGWPEDTGLRHAPGIL